MEKNCENCLKIFNVKPSKFDRTKFCSMQCKEDYSEKNYAVNLESRFLSFCNKTESCWIWTGNIDNYGYGYLTIMKPKKHKCGAHRISMMIFKPNENINGLHVCHSCHNKLCVNPNHLHPGTAADNIAEMVEVDRQAKGEGLPQAKLTEENVKDILDRLKKGVSVETLANQYNVTVINIYKIKQNKSWKHITRI